MGSPWGTLFLMSNLKDLMTSREVCRLLGVSRTQLTRFGESGTLVPATRLPGKTGPLLFDRDDVVALKKARDQRDQDQAAALAAATGGKAPALAEEVA